MTNHIWQTIDWCFLHEFPTCSKTWQRKFFLHFCWTSFVLWQKSTSKNCNPCVGKLWWPFWRRGKEGMFKVFYTSPRPKNQFLIPSIPSTVYFRSSGVGVTNPWFDSFGEQRHCLEVFHFDFHFITSSPIESSTSLILHQFFRTTIFISATIASVASIATITTITTIASIATIASPIECSATTSMIYRT